MVHACFKAVDSWPQCLALWREGLNAFPIARHVPSRVLVVPPDITRAHSGAAELIGELCRLWPKSAFDVLPALGTHRPMTQNQLRLLYGELPDSVRYLRHDWRNDTVEIGVLAAHEVSAVLGFPVLDQWRVRISRSLVDTHYDAIISIGQVMPHEVVGMSNYTKNIIIGLGGIESINLTHYWSACYGMRRIIGRPLNPIRTLLQMVADRYLANFQIYYAMTVMHPVATDAVVPHDNVDAAAFGTAPSADAPAPVTSNIAPSGGALATTTRYQPHALVVGRDMDAFCRAAEYSQQVHIIPLDTPIQKAVVYLQPQIYRSLWIANKAIYRLGDAMARGGELVIIANIEQYAEDPIMNEIIAQYGYNDPEGLNQKMAQNPYLQQHAAAVAHIMHSAHDHFTVRFALSPARKRFITAVGFEFMAFQSAQREYGPFLKQNGWYRSASGERYYFANDPAHYLWRLT